MSCYNWEAGSFKLPVAEWAKFKKAFRLGFNVCQEADLTEAKRHWYKYHAVKPPTFRQGERESNAEFYRFQDEQNEFYYLWRDKNGELRKRPRAPKRSDFPLATSRQNVFNFGEAFVSFDNDTREVRYDSGENNRAVEYARENPVGKLFFRLLKGVKWTRGTGGQLCGNDEYNRDSTDPGGGGNYVTLQLP